MVALAAASASARNVCGRARTSLRSAAFASPETAAGPASRDSACASAAGSPLRAGRAPPTSGQPPPRPGCGDTGIPAADSASRSRRAVATDTSSSPASSAAVTRLRACMSRRAATRRSARMSQFSATKCSVGEHFNAENGTITDHWRKEPPMLRGLTTVNYLDDDVAAAADWYTELLGAGPYFSRPAGGTPAYVEFRIGDYQHE